MNEYDQRPSGNDTNGWGLAGFIVALISLIGCGGLLSPFSLIFSIVGMTRPNKGFAIAGLVLSILGLLMIIGMLFFGGLAVIAAVLGAGLLVAGVALVAQVGENAFTVVEAIGDYHDTHQSVPASLDELDLQPSDRTDTWGNEFVYMPGVDGDSFMLISAGPDEQLGNRDDIVGELRLEPGFDMEIHTGYDSIEPGNWTGTLPPAGRVDAPTEAEPPAPAETPTEPM